MANISRFIKVHKDVLVEWIRDDEFYYANDYSIITDISNLNRKSFSFNTTATDVDNPDYINNKLPDQLYSIDTIINKFGIANPSVKTFLQESQNINNAPSKFDIVKIWFPIHYNFVDTMGFYFNIFTKDFNNSLNINLCNYYLDITNTSSFLKIKEEINPIRLNERLWGKSITLLIPSVYNESRNRSNNAPNVGSINYNLTTVGLSQTSPIYLDFRFYETSSEKMH
jgi:hypothetical protein